MITGSWRFILAALATLFSMGTAAFGEEKKEAAKSPTIMFCSPLAVERGFSGIIHLYGTNLTELTSVNASIGDSKLTVLLSNKSKFEPPKDTIKEKTGDTQADIEIKAPADSVGKQIHLEAIGSSGVGSQYSIQLRDAGTLTPEKEPNGGFRTAQPIDRSTTIVGTIGEENDVDVFKFEFKSNQKLVAEVTAARAGSPLDSLLVVYDEHGHVVASNDDASGSADSRLSISLPKGVYFLSLTDAGGKGGAMYPYLLDIRIDALSDDSHPATSPERAANTH